MKKIRLFRQQQGITQEKLAEKSGLSRSSIINFEIGRRSPQIKDLQKIANALNISVKDLI